MLLLSCDADGGAPNSVLSVPRLLTAELHDTSSI